MSSNFHAQVYGLYNLHKGPKITKKGFLILTNVLLHVGKRITECDIHASTGNDTVSFQDVKKGFIGIFRGELKAQTWTWTKRAFRQYKVSPQRSPNLSKRTVRTLFPGLSPSALLFLTCVLEFLTMQIIDHLKVLAGELDWKKILPRHVRLVMMHDDELRHLLRNQTVLFFISKPIQGNSAKGKPKLASLTTLGQMEEFLETHQTKIKTILKKHFTRKRFLISFHPDTCLANGKGLQQLFSLLNTKAEICVPALKVCGLIFQKFGYIYLAP